MFELSIMQFSVLDTLLVKLHLTIAQYEFRIIFIRQYFITQPLLMQNTSLVKECRFKCKLLKYFHVYIIYVVLYDDKKHGSNSQKD